MENLVLACIQCDNEFVFNIADQKRFERLGFDAPRRCPACRRHKSKGMAATTESNWKKSRRKNHKGMDEDYA